MLKNRTLEKVSNVSIAVASLTAIFGAIVFTANDGHMQPEVVTFVERLCCAVVVFSIGSMVCTGIAFYRDIKAVSSIRGLYSR